MPYKKDITVSLDCIDSTELLARINSKSNFVLVDTIGSYNGNRYRIKGATTIPYTEVIDRRRELIPYGEIIIYCKHRDCVASKKGAIGLKMLNIRNVKVYEGGIDEWTESGLPLEEV